MKKKSVCTPASLLLAGLTLTTLCPVFAEAQIVPRFPRVHHLRGGVRDVSVKLGNGRVSMPRVPALNVSEPAQPKISHTGVANEFGQGRRGWRAATNNTAAEATLQDNFGQGRRGWRASGRNGAEEVNAPLLQTSVQRTAAQAELGQGRRGWKGLDQMSSEQIGKDFAKMLSQHGSISIDYAAADGNFDLVRYMADNGATISAKTLQQALPYAEMMSYLLTRPQVNSHSLLMIEGSKLARQAIRKGYLETTAVLAKHLKDNPVKLDSMLWEAVVEFNQPEIATMLIQDFQADANWVFANAFSYEQKLSTQGLTFLLEHNVDPTQRVEAADLTNAMHALARWATAEEMEQFALLKKYGADVNAIDPVTGNTPLHEAALNPQAAAELLALDADPTITNNAGLNALDYAQEMLATKQAQWKRVKNGTNENLKDQTLIDITNANKTVKLLETKIKPTVSAPAATPKEGIGPDGKPLSGEQLMAIAQQQMSLFRTIRHDNVSAKYYIKNNQYFNPLEQSVLRAQAENHPLALYLADEDFIARVIAGDDQSPREAVLFGDIRDYVERTAYLMSRGYSWGETPLKDVIVPLQYFDEYTQSMIDEALYHYQKH